MLVEIIIKKRTIAADSANLFFQIRLAIVLPRLTEKVSNNNDLDKLRQKRPTCSFEDMNGTFNLA